MWDTISTQVLSGVGSGGTTTHNRMPLTSSERAPLRFSKPLCPHWKMAVLVPHVKRLMYGLNNNVEETLCHVTNSIRNRGV